MRSIFSSFLENLKKIKPYLTSSFIVCLLGYCVDQYDLGLFALVRVQSLKSLGFNESQVLENGVHLLNLQMLGLLIGGVLGGVLGDRKGRSKILYASMLFYSVGNILNAFVYSIPAYSFCRFIAGLGLAAEIGASVTIMAETLPIHVRGIALMIMVGLGHASGLMASLIVPRLDWRLNFFVGGCLGLVLLLARLKVSEPEMYQKVKSSTVKLGGLSRVFKTKNGFSKYIRGIAIGLPNYYVSLMTAFGPEFAKALGLTETITTDSYYPYFFASMVIGDFTSGYLSHKFQTRKKIIMLYHLIMIFSVSMYFLIAGKSFFLFCCAMVGMGFASGQWVLVNTVAAEQFGTNVRATVATSTPNFIRASSILINYGFIWLKPAMGSVSSAVLIGLFCLMMAFLASISLEETYNKNLDYVES